MEAFLHLRKTSIQYEISTRQRTANTHSLAGTSWPSVKKNCLYRPISNASLRYVGKYNESFAGAAKIHLLLQPTATTDPEKLPINVVSGNTMGYRLRKVTPAFVRDNQTLPDKIPHSKTTDRVEIEVITAARQYINELPKAPGKLVALAAGVGGAAVAGGAGAAVAAGGAVRAAEGPQNLAVGAGNAGPAGAGRVVSLAKANNGSSDDGIPLGDFGFMDVGAAGLGTNAQGLGKLGADGRGELVFRNHDLDFLRRQHEHDLLESRIKKSRRYPFKSPFVIPNRLAGQECFEQGRFEQRGPGPPQRQHERFQASEKPEWQPVWRSDQRQIR